MWLIPLIALPFVELWTVLELGSIVGVGVALAWCIAGLVAGVALMRRGRTLVMRRVARGQELSDARAVLEDGLLVVAGALIAFPGLVSDVLGLALLVPAVRRFAVSVLARVRPAARARPFGPPPVRPTRTASPDVEIYPPGTLRQPVRRRPVVIDVD